MTGPARAASRRQSRIRRWYGAHPLHLLALLAAFGLAGYAVSAVVAAGQWPGFVLWFAVAIVGHDLLLFPLYSLADLSVRRLLPGWAGGVRTGRLTGGGPGRAGSGPIRPPTAPPVLNYFRIPVAFSLLILLVWFPLILGFSERVYHRASGLTTAPYLGRWLGVTGVLFAVSAFAYALALRRAVSRARRGPPAPPASR